MENNVTYVFNVANVINNCGLDIVFHDTVTDGKLFTLSLQNDKQFQNELRILGGLRSLFLVTLLGYCVKQNKHLLGTDNLSDKNLQEPFFEDGHLSMNWQTRFDIILDSVEAFEFLQFNCDPVIHEDIKSNDVLFDSEYRVKISDFGLLRIKIEGDFEVNLFCQELWKNHDLYSTFEGTTSADTPAIGTEVSFTLVLQDFISIGKTTNSYNQFRMFPLMSPAA
ncbi:hypothetical protein V6N13_085137 [Hibiscus sabdariffa]|uniref:Protein kinase domain-containing protein n=1 Tax=Hibiscus sabdariffa TaxID=183260 RepID=A0ABR2D0P1_9ROSI